MTQQLANDAASKLAATPVRGCRFYRVDLHVHSPASYDFKAAKTMSADDFVGAWGDAGVELIALTDHNTGAFVDAALEARKRIVKKGLPAPVILPGVELTVTGGVHLLAIFPSGHTADIDHFLSALGLPLDQRGKKTALVTKAIEDIKHEVTLRDGLLIGAHCHSEIGILGALDGQTRIRFLQCVDALEISTQAANPAKIQNRAKEVGSSLPFTVGSDNHDPATIKPAMWLKMAECCHSGVRQLLYEPTLRSTTSQPLDSSHPWIMSFFTTAGLYGGVDFNFSPHLNVLIGGKGAGKSAVIDLIRFAFDVEPHDSDKLKLFSKRIAAFLAGSGRVVLTVRAADGKNYAIVRSGIGQQDTKRGYRFDEKPSVWALSTKPPMLLDKAPLSLAPVEFYGQGEVALLADRANEQLRLIDDHVDFGSLKTDEIRLDKESATQEADIIALSDELTELEGQISTLDELKKRVKYLDKQLAHPVFKRHQAWNKQKAVVDSQSNWIKNVAKSIPLKFDKPSPPPAGFKSGPSAKLLLQVTELADQLRKALTAGRDESLKAIEAAQVQLRPLLESWAKSFQKAKDDYQSKLEEMDATEEAEAAEERVSKTDDIQKIEDILVPRRDEVVNLLKSHGLRRLQRLNELRKSRDAIHDLRSEIVKSLNASLDENQVQIRLAERPDQSVFAEGLSDALDASGMTNRTSQIPQLCANMDQVSIVAVIRAGDAATLTTTGKLSPGNAKILLKHLDEATVMKLERIATPRLPTVMLKREGETSFTPLDSLSDGERCSAILTIALLDKNKPLVIDQPEDEIDHAFVTDSIVGSIRRVKASRQILTATHNANIPVLGDAELILRVQRSPVDKKCLIRAAGGLEMAKITNEIQLLEGGPEAFAQRSRRYGFTVLDRSGKVITPTPA